MFRLRNAASAPRFLSLANVCRRRVLLQNRHFAVKNIEDSREKYFQDISNDPIKQTQLSPYPSSFLRPSLTICQFLHKYGSLQPGEQLSDEVSLSGRIGGRRDSGSKLIFFDLVSGVTRNEEKVSKVQLRYGQKQYTAPNPELVQSVLRRGDLVSVRGYPLRTKSGELSLVPLEMQLLSPCLKNLPEKLQNVELRARQRHLDLLVNRPVLDRFIMRTKVLHHLRQFLQSHGFLEVETPVLWNTAGGAAARPFRTFSNALSTEFSLRIAPELFLKQLVIGGMHKVFEISKVFRNEGIDSTHNPEFTTCEFYQAFASCDDLLDFTENLLRDITYQVTGSYQVPLAWNAASDETTGQSGPVIDFSQPFQRLEILPTLQKILNEPSLPDPNSPESIDAWRALASKHGIALSAPYTNAHILDKFISHVLEPLCTQPTFLVGHPECMSPLAKSNPTKPGITERFELFIGGKEICNAYSELNDPHEQRKRFALQAQAKDAGDEEAQILDEPFCAALEYGLPPTAGWGLGVDRLCMLLSQTPHIREVILFPLLKSVPGSD